MCVYVCMCVCVCMHMWVTMCNQVHLHTVFVLLYSVCRSVSVCFLSFFVNIIQFFYVCVTCCYLEVMETVREKARGNSNNLSHVPSKRKEEIKSGISLAADFLQVLLLVVTTDSNGNTTTLTAAFTVMLSRLSFLLLLLLLLLLLWCALGSGKQYGLLGTREEEEKGLKKIGPIICTVENEIPKY